jgi:uncharacterized protein (DUF736 family)
MAQIGHFTRGKGGILSGTIQTLVLNVKARFVLTEPSSNEKALALRVFAGTVDIGAAWKRLRGKHRLSLGQARRPVLPDADFRQPG